MWTSDSATSRIWRRLWAATFAVLLLAGLLLYSAPAAAQNNCGPRDKVLAVLGGQYQENTVAIGLASSGGVIEVLAAEDGSTWTIVLTTPDGISCVVSSGEAWIDIVRRAKGEIS